jgi:hypothetical protein
LPMPGSAEVPYAKCRPELKDYTEAQTARDMLASNAWAEVMAPVVDAIEEARLVENKEAPVYTTQLLESLQLFQRVCGLRSYRETRNLLASDRGREARELLGLNKVRRYRNKPGKRVLRLQEGIPSESTMSRHLRRVPEQRRADLYEDFFRCYAREHAADEDLRREARTLNMDGTAILTHYTCPIIDPKTEKIVNEESITCHDGGYVPYERGPGKSGHGWNLITLTTTTGVPLAYKLVPLHASEKNTAVELLKDYSEHVQPYLGERQLTVLSADGGFNKPLLRAKARELGLLENIHLASHSNSQISKDNAEERNNKRIPFDDPNYTHWYANGHREVLCECGKRANKRIRLNSNGQVVSRVEGRCDKCGSITITSGDWRKAENPLRFTRCHPSEPAGKRDWQLGNPLTFNSREGNEYGQQRFYYNEGFYGALSSRFQLNKGKRWFRRRDQARIDTAIIFSVMHAVAIEQRRRLRAAQALGPPLRAAA